MTYKTIRILNDYHWNKNDNIHKNEVQNIGFGIPIEFLSQRKKNIQIGTETTQLDFSGQDSHLVKVKHSNFR